MFCTSFSPYLYFYIPFWTGKEIFEVWYCITIKVMLAIQSPDFDPDPNVNPLNGKFSLETYITNRVKIIGYFPDCQLQDITWANLNYHTAEAYWSLVWIWILWTFFLQLCGRSHWTRSPCYLPWKGSKCWNLESRLTTFQDSN